MIKKINWGIIGLGKIANKFATALAEVKDANLHAVASRSSQKAQVFAELHNAKIAYGSYIQIMQDPEIDVIYIATPHSHHHKISIDCLKNGKAVLCEKPFALTLKEAEEMVEVAKSHGVFLMEAMWTGFLPHFKNVLEEINSGKYGKVVSIKADFGFKADFDPNKRLFNKALGGGSLMDIGIYPVFLAYSILGKPETIKAEAQYAETGVDLECEIEFQYPDQVKAHLFSSFKEKTPTIAEIEMENGKIILNSRFHEPTSITLIHNGEKETRDFRNNSNGYNFEAEHVTRMLKEGKKESDVMDFRKTLDIMETLDIIRNKIALEY